VSLFGKNLLDEAIAGGDTQVPFGGALAGAVPGGQNLSNGVNAPFDPNPAAGTFQPLQPGRTDRHRVHHPRLRLGRVPNRKGGSSDPPFFCRRGTRQR
jgi:hypothetical protein